MLRPKLNSQLYVLMTKSQTRLSFKQVERAGGAFLLPLSLQETTQETVKRFWKAIQAFALGSTPLCAGSRKEVKNTKVTAQPAKTSESERPRQSPHLTGCCVFIVQQ